MKNSTAPILQTVFLAAGVVFATGCSTIKIPDYVPPAAASSQSPVRTVEGVELQVDPFTDPERVKTHFGAALRNLGIFPVYVSAKNVSPDRTYLLTREQFTLGDSGGAAQGTGATDAPAYRSGAGEAVSMAGAAVISLPLLFVGSKMIIDAEAVQHNLIKQEFQNQMLEPGDSVSGFIYFSLQKDAPPLITPVVRVKVVETPSNRAWDIQF
jgi:hypothetical protein